MLKKTSNARPLTGSVINGYSDSTVNTYSCDYINKMDVYSTDETKTNKIWVIDGVNYPVYRKEIIITNPTTGSWRNVSIGLTNIRKLEIEKAYMVRGNNSNPIPVWESDNNNVAIGTDKGYGYIQYRINGFSGTIVLDITIEYTKTS